MVDVEELIPADHPARAIWEIVGQVDLSRFYDEIKAVEGAAGRSAYDPHMLISVWIHAYSEGEGLARRIARLCRYTPAYQWLTGLQEISYHTLSDFRVCHEEELNDLFVQVLGVLSAEGLIGLQRVTHDGVKIKTCGGANAFRLEGTLREHLKTAKEQVERLSQQRDEGVSERQAKARQRAARERKERVETALRELQKIRGRKKGKEAKEEARASMTEAEARIMKQADGGYAPCYNVQISTDMGEGIVVGVGVTNEGSDYGELLKGIDKVGENTGMVPDQVVTDGGYTSRENIINAAERGIDYIGSFGEEGGQSEGQMKRRGVAPEFRPEAFCYDEARDMFICPAGKSLKYESKERSPGKTSYQYRARASDCFACRFKEQCCPQNRKKGRAVRRGIEDPEVEAFRKKMETEEAREIYRQRGRWAEFPHAWIKEKMGIRKFHLHGLEKTFVEMLWACLAYNIKQWIRLRWKERLVAVSA
jgi:transposase